MLVRGGLELCLRADEGLWAWPERRRVQRHLRPRLRHLLLGHGERVTVDADRVCEALPRRHHGYPRGRDPGGRDGERLRSHARSICLELRPRLIERCLRDDQVEVRGARVEDGNRLAERHPLTRRHEHAHDATGGRREDGPSCRSRRRCRRRPCGTAGAAARCECVCRCMHIDDLAEATDSDGHVATPGNDGRHRRASRHLARELPAGDPGTCHQQRQSNQQGTLLHSAIR